MDKILKFLQKRTKKERRILLNILKDIRDLKTANYDTKALTGFKGFYRIRHGKFRIIFSQGKNKGIIISVNLRKDAYKK